MALCQCGFTIHTIICRSHWQVNKIRPFDQYTDTVWLLTLVDVQNIGSFQYLVKYLNLRFCNTSKYNQILYQELADLMTGMKMQVGAKNVLVTDFVAFSISRATITYFIPTKWTRMEVLYMPLKAIKIKKIMEEANGSNSRTMSPLPQIMEIQHVPNN